jgi:hypothetical protein
MAPVVVSVTDEYLDRFGEVLEALRARGLVIDHVLDDLGTVTGSIDTDEVEALGSLTGVASVERQRQPGIAPPESDVQ